MLRRGVPGHRGRDARCAGSAGSRRCTRGTLLAGAAIALTQVVTPAWVRAKAPERAGVLTGAFSMSLVAGATIATFTAIPFEDAFGGWEPALAIWALPALVAAAVWLPLALRAHDPVAAPVGDAAVARPDGVVDRALHGPAVDGVLLDHHVAAGDPRGRRVQRGLRGHRCPASPSWSRSRPRSRSRCSPRARRTQTHLLAVIVGTALIGLLGVLVAPGRRAAVDGLPRHRPGRRARPRADPAVLRGRDPGQVAGMTAMAMGVGYLIAAAGPALVGAVRDVTRRLDVAAHRADRDDGARWPRVPVAAVTATR